MSSLLQTLLKVSVGAGLILVWIGCESPGPGYKEQARTAWDTQRAALKYELASTELKQGRADKALSLAREAVGLSPQQPGHAELLARVYIALGDFNTARNILHNIQIEHPDSGSAAYLLGTIYEREQDWERAIEAYTWAVDVCPYNLDYRIALAQVTAQAGSSTVATSILTENSEQFTSDPKYHLAYADLCQQTSNLAEACAAYRRVLLLGYDDPEVRASLGLCLYWSGRTREALEILEPLVKQIEQPESAVMCAYAGCLLMRGEASRAADWLVRFTGQRSDVAESWLLLAQARSALGDSNGAVAAAGRAVRLSPRSPEVLSMAATAYLAAGEISVAEQSVQQALEIDPDNLTALLIHGRLCEQRGDAQAAAVAYRAAWNLEPSDFIAGLLARLEE